MNTQNQVQRSPIISVVMIAKTAHEINRAYCKSIGDESQPSWEDAPEWQKDSAINGVNFHLLNPDADPKASHENWLAQKTAEGWQYGEEKNVEAKTHPCFVPYEQLPVEQRAKDFLFRQVVHSMAAVDTMLQSELAKDTAPVVKQDKMDLYSALMDLSKSVVHGGLRQRMHNMAEEIRTYKTEQEG